MIFIEYPAALLRGALTQLDFRSRYFQEHQTLVHDLLSPYDLPPLFFACHLDPAKIRAQVISSFPRSPPLKLRPLPAPRRSVGLKVIYTLSQPLS